MKTLNENEIQIVSGGSMNDSAEKEQYAKDGGRALGMAAAIGIASFGGAGWGAMTAGAAFAAAPIAVAAMVVLAGYAGYAGYRYFTR